MRNLFIPHPQKLLLFLILVFLVSVKWYLMVLVWNFLKTNDEYLLMYVLEISMSLFKYLLGLWHIFFIGLYFYYSVGGVLYLIWTYKVNYYLSLFIVLTRSPVWKIAWPCPCPPQTAAIAAGLTCSLMPDWSPFLSSQCWMSEPLATLNRLALSLSNSLLPQFLFQLLPSASIPLAACTLLAAACTTSPCDRPLHPLSFPPWWDHLPHVTWGPVPPPTWLAPIPCALFVAWPLESRCPGTPPSSRVPPHRAGAMRPSQWTSWSSPCQHLQGCSIQSLPTRTCLKLHTSQYMPSCLIACTHAASCWLVVTVWWCDSHRLFII